MSATQPAPVDGGRWYTANDVDRRGWQRCGICGRPNDRLVQDHCHSTGLVRGLICYSCNSREAFSEAPAFVAWRTTAPGLEVGHREFYCGAGTESREGLGHSTAAELMTLPIEELLSRAAAHRTTRHRESTRIAASVMGSILAGVPAGAA